MKKLLTILITLLFPLSILAGDSIKFSSLGLESGVIKDTLFQKEKMKIDINCIDNNCQYKKENKSLFIPAGTVIQITANEDETLSGVSLVYTNKDKKKHNLFSCDKGEFKNGIWKGDANTIELTSLDDCSISEVRVSFTSDPREAYAVGIWHESEYYSIYNGEYDARVDHIECDYQIDFYYDEHKSLHNGDIFPIDGVSEYPGWYDLQDLDSWKEVWTKIEESDYDDPAGYEWGFYDVYEYGNLKFNINSSFADYHPKRTSHWFENTSCTISGMEYLNTSEVVDMSYMFANFSYVKKLHDHEVVEYDSNKSSMDEDMSGGVPNRSNIHKMMKDDSDWWNYNFEYEEEKFYSSIFNLFDFTKVQNLSYMFASCSMERFELSSLQLPSTVNTTGMFQNNNLKYVTLVSNDIILNDNFFDGLSENNPCVIAAPSSFNFNTDTHSDTFKWKGGWFKGFRLQPYVVEKKYKRHDFYDEGLSGGHDINYEEISLTFYYDNNINIHKKDIYYDSWETLYLGLDHNSVGSNSASVSIKIHQLNEDNADPSWIGIGLPDSYMINGGSMEVQSSNISINIDESFEAYRPKSTYRWFDILKDPYQKVRLKSINGLQYLNTSETTNAERMFNGLGVEKLDLSHLDLTKATNTSQMLNNCFKLRELSVNSTMSDLDPSACLEIGNYSPCIIYAPEGFTFETDTSNDRFCWKSGNFILPNVEDKTKAYAILDNDTLTLYYDSKLNDRSGEGYVIERMFDDDILWEMVDSLAGNMGWEDYMGERLGYFSLRDIDNYNHLIIDPSFANKPLGETMGWFAADYDYWDWNDRPSGPESISGLENIHSSSMFGMFQGCNNLESLDLSKMDMSRTTNTDYMFGDCSSLSQIFLPPTCKLIGEYAFENCTSLSTITIPSNVTYIGGNAFKACDNLSIVKVENPIPIKIFESSFPGRSNTTLYVPTGSRDAYLAADYWKDFKDIVEYSDVIPFVDPTVKSICVANWDTNGDGELEMSEAAAVTSLGTVFKKKKDTTSFNELRYFTGLKSINEGAFASSKIQEVILPVTVESLEKDAFLYCNSLVSLHIPDKVASMGMNALSGCTSMTSITVDEDNDTYCSVNGVLFTKDKKQLLQFPCAKSTVYTVPEGTEVIGRDAFFQAKVTSVTLPSTIKELVYDAFGYCKQLTELEMPDGLEIIGDYIFDACTALKTIYIPSTVTSIGKSMTQGCNAITDVYSAIRNPEAINDNNFTSTVYKNATLHVPAGTREKYATIGGWSNFTHIDTSLSLYCEAEPVHPGMTTNLPIFLSIDGENLYNGYQFDIKLPEGFSLAKDGNNYSYTLADDRYTDNMLVSFNELSDNKWRVMVYSLNNALLTGLDGDVITLSITAGEDVAVGDYTGNISNFKLSRIDNKTVSVPAVTLDIKVVNFAKGDANHDGVVDISDVMMTVYKALAKPVANFHMEEADINRDGEIDISDVMSIVNIMLGKTVSYLPSRYREDHFTRLLVKEGGEGYSFSLEGGSGFTGMQMVVTLPECSVLRSASLGGQCTSQSIRYKAIGGNRYNVVVWSTDESSFGIVDDFIKLDTSGKKGIAISDIRFTDDMFESIIHTGQDGTPTFITNISREDNEDPLYNLQGMKVTHPGKGVYIQNNKKVIVK